MSKFKYLKAIVALAFRRPSSSHPSGALADMDSIRSSSDGEDNAETSRSPTLNSVSLAGAQDNLDESTKPTTQGM
jgi:hypothetical protein